MPLCEVAGVSVQWEYRTVLCSRLQFCTHGRPCRLLEIGDVGVFTSQIGPYYKLWAPLPKS